MIIPLAILCATLALCYAAATDYIEHKVANRVSAFLWMCAGLINEPIVSIWAVASFSAMFLGNELFKRPLLSWGDLLVFPPVIGIAALITGSGNVAALIIGIAIFGGLYNAYYRGKEEPLVPYALVGFGVCVLFSILGYLHHVV